MALIDAWQAGRQQRQQEVAQRQQAVQQILSEFGVARQQAALQLQSDLGAFREGLIQQEQRRRADFCELAAELQLFRDALRANVRSLREAMQVDIATRQVDVQSFLSACQEQRLQVSAETRAELAAFMAALRSEVDGYLAELEILRHERAIQLQQNLQQSRTVREAEVQGLFERFATFRAKRREFRRSLSESVWGISPSVEFTKSYPQLLPLGVPKPVSAQTSASQSATKPASAKPTLAKLSSKSPQTKRPVGKTTAPKGTPKVTANLSTAAKTVPVANVSLAQPTSPTVETQSNDVAFEKEVYTFLHQNQGARLTQIESSLKINRFQAVDALRSLIKKGLITQRDRVYLTQAAAQS